MKFCFTSGRTIVLVLLLALALVACGSGGETSLVAISGSDPDPEPEPTPTFSLSGSVYVERDSDVDDDVGNIQAQNNQIGNAQRVANPLTLGGYVSGLQGCYSSDFDCLYEPGAEFSFGKDTQDFFQVSLVKNQQIGLSVFYADTSGALTGTIDVSLFLRLQSDVSSTVSALTFSGEGTKTLTVENTGDYYIEVNAAENVSEPVLYTLSLSKSLIGTSLGAASLNPTSHFVPGEVIVRFKTNDESTGFGLAALASQQSETTKTDLRIKRAIGQAAKLYHIEAATLNKALSFESVESGSYLSTRMKKKWQTVKTIEKLRARDDVLYAEPNYIRTATAVPPVNDPEYDKQWSLPMLELPAAWEVSTGQGVTVAVIDTGIDPDHQDLDGNIALQDGYDFIEDDALSGDLDPGSDTDPRDMGSTFHGSHVAGIIAAEGNNGMGITGVAYDASIMPLRVLGVNGEGFDADIANAILYAAGLTNSSGRLPIKKADIINLSLGSPDDSDVINAAVSDAVAEGVIVIAAAGNDSSSTEFFPAASPSVIAVSSVTSNKTLSTFSNFGDYIDVAAPGGTGINDPLFDGFQDGILSTVYASEYAELVGTSMAAPHVAGVAALMKAKQPTLDPLSFAGALPDITDNLGNTQLFGFGLINAAKAMIWAGQTLPASLNVFPNQFGFIGATTDASLTLTNPGSDGRVVTATVQENEDWIDVTNYALNSVDQNGLGKYKVEIDSTKVLPNETKTGLLMISYRIDNGALQVMEIEVFASNSQQTDDTVGQLLVYLIRKQDVDNSGEGDLIGIYAGVGGQLSDGVYDFQFYNIPPGQYFLEASTDNDDDFIFFDEGEARGAYPLFSQPDLITVTNRNIQDLDFDVQFQSFAQSSGQSANAATSLSGRTFKAQARTPPVLRKIR